MGLGGAACCVVRAVWGVRVVCRCVRPSSPMPVSAPTRVRASLGR